MDTLSFYANEEAKREKQDPIVQKVIESYNNRS